MTLEQEHTLFATKERKKHTYSSLVSVENTLSYDFSQDLYEFRAVKDGDKIKFSINLMLETDINELELQALALKSQKALMRVLQKMNKNV